MSTEPFVPHPLKAALNGENCFFGQEEGECPFIRACYTLQLLIDLGADPKLCVEEDQRRIEQLLGLSDADVQTIMQFQVLISILPDADKPFKHDLTCQETKRQLLEMIEGGADLMLCCKKDRLIIEDFLNWPNEKLDTYETQSSQERAALFCPK